MKLTDDFVNDGYGHNDPSWLVIHETANPNATAADHAEFWKSRTQEGDAHYVVDWIEAFHTIPDDRIAYHVGGVANCFSVGIEICHATNAADFEKVWNNAVELAAYVLQELDIDVSRMVSHKWANEHWNTGSDHTDPIGYFAEFGRTWDDFVNDVMEMIDMTTAKEIWEYDWEETAPAGNMYNCAVETNKLVRELLERVKKLEKEIEDIK